MRPWRKIVQQFSEQVAQHLPPLRSLQDQLRQAREERDRLIAEVKRLRDGLPVGGFFPFGSDTSLSAAEQDVVNAFHDLYYRRWQAGYPIINISWLGYETLKCPLDLWIYQELIASQRPDFIIECGTCYGGSAYFLASICQLIGTGRVITIDCDATPRRPQHERITYLSGRSTDPEIVARVRALVGTARNNLVILDSDHSRDNVLAEIKTYKSYVPLGGYLIVEDTNINGHPTFPEFGPGPMEAVDAFLANSQEFRIDPSCERFMMTLNPRGYLRRVAAAVS